MGQNLSKRVPINELQYKVGDTRREFSRVENLDDIRVINSSGGLRLAEEPKPSGWVRREMMAEQLDCDGSSENRIASEVDGSHSSAAEASEQLDTGGQRCCELFFGLHICRVVRTGGSASLAANNCCRCGVKTAASADSLGRREGRTAVRATNL